MARIISDDNKVMIKGSETLIITCDKADIEYDLKDGDYSILIFNDSNKDLYVYDHGSINNADVRINYLQLDDNKLNQVSKIDVNENSTLTINAIYLGVKEKNIKFDLYNAKRNSTIDIHNNVVCLDGSSFNLDCIGTINKGSKNARCHQANRCLTLGSPKKANVKPVLNIDENDVEASHSLSSGTIDEEILFYMNSRGLSASDALNLILRSYLMPDDNYYENFIDGKDIQSRAIKKVDEVCSM